MPATAARLRPWQPEDRKAASLYAWEGAIRFLPLILCGGFYVATILLFAFGPTDWAVSEPKKLYGYLTAYTVALFAGYTYAVLRRRRREETAPPNSIRSPNANRLLIVAGIVTLLIYFPTVHTTTGQWIPDVWQGLTDAGNAYQNNKYWNSYGSQLVLYVRMLLGPLLILTLPITLFCWPRLSRLARVLGIGCMVAQVALYIAQGVNKGIAELSAYLILAFALWGATALRKRAWKEALKPTLGIVLVLALFFAIYAVTMRSRATVPPRPAPTTTTATTAAAPPATTAPPPATTAPPPAATTPPPATTAPPPAATTSIPAPSQPPSTSPPSREEVDDTLEQYAEMSFGTIRPDHIYFKVVPKPLQAPGLLLISYVTHGYKGLSMAMDHQFTSSYGLGFSEFIRHNFMRLIGHPELEDDVFYRTYNAKINSRAWTAGMLWPTFFIYPANDVGFGGVIPVMALIGVAFGAAWRDTVTRGDPLAAVVFFHLCLLVFYLSANNQLFQNGESTIGFSTILLAWLILRRRRRVRPVTTEASDG